MEGRSSRKRMELPLMRTQHTLCRHSRPARSPTTPREDRPPDYRMSDEYLDRTVHPLSSALRDIRVQQNGGTSVHCYGGFVIVQQRLPNQPVRVTVFRSDDGYQHCKAVDLGSLPRQALLDLVRSMSDLGLSPIEIATATRLRSPSVHALLNNDQPDV